ncbi:hypothetical protein LVD15_25980 [Fulvivirga maritima]|uniref:hypothetical protein n=1 Tax=Fulvivirga maritima TaxID=2904247 RepID=UPI001F475ECE|nr:hypothetical protein [Fulvivirga maritima]UII26703.1 hypothetical protein LVD15_25980 [Fulvivirga maritima]
MILYLCILKKESWRYHVYINADTFRPIFIEYLSRNEEGSPLQYIKYLYGYQIYDYKWEDNEDHPCHVNVSSFSPDDELIRTEKYLVTYKNVIVDKIINEDGIEVHNSENLDKDISQIIEEVKAQVIANVGKMMEEKGHLFKGKIAFALFEYVFDAAFPPILALATQEEADREEDPLLAYSAADLLYFSESDEYYFDLNSEGSDKFDILNEHISETLEYEDAVTLARTVYSDICKSPELYEIFNQHLDIADDFHITVFDMDAVDLDEMLPLTVSKEVQQKLWGKQQAYLESRQIPDEYLRIIAEMNEACQVDPEEWQKLVSEAKEVSTSHCYLSDFHFYIQPLLYEQCHREHAPYSDFIRLTGASLTPEPDKSCKHYLDAEGRICMIEQVNNDKITLTKVFKYEPHQIQAFTKRSQRNELDSIATLSLKNGLPDSLINYDLRLKSQDIQTLCEIKYTMEGEHVKQATESTLYFHINENFYSKNIYKYVYTYSPEGKLTKTDTYLENDVFFMSEDFKPLDYSS